MNARLPVLPLFSLLVAALLCQLPASRIAPAQESDAMEEAHRAASLLALDRLRSEEPVLYARLRKCPPQSILLVNGSYDHTDRILRSLRLPFRSCPASAFEHQPLGGVRLLIIDCPGRVGSRGAHRVRHFVERGGTLLTTDWAVLHVLEPAFPGWVRYTRRPARDDVVRISTVSPDPLLRRLFPPGRFACWWIENESYPVEILDPRVHVLLGSREMEQKYGAAPLGLSFRWGRGRVVHIVSHTYLQRNDARLPWERRSVAAEARSLGLPVESDSYRELKKSGALERISAGDLNAALSAQQFLLNVTAVAFEAADEAVPEDEPPPADVRPESPADSFTVRRDTHLRGRPGGTPYLRVQPGLRLSVFEKRDGWRHVRTPAGQTGWIAQDELVRPNGRRERD